MKWVTRAFVLAWILLAGAGFAALQRHAFEAGDSGSSPAPDSASAILRPADSFQLVVSIHPRCPCSRATLDELAVVMDQAGPRLTALVLFFKPAGEPDAWVETDTWRAAKNLSNVSVLADTEGALARSFGAATSGDAVLFNPSLDPVFHGGLTASRGHAGDNAGRRSILALVQGGEAEAIRTPVFGCSLQTPAAAKDGL